MKHQILQVSTDDFSLVKTTPSHAKRKKKVNEDATMVNKRNNEQQRAAIKNLQNSKLVQIRLEAIKNEAQLRAKEIQL